jgi:hypothetical protein
MNWWKLIKGILILWTSLTLFSTALVLFDPFLGYLDTQIALTPELRWLPVNVFLVILVWFAFAIPYGIMLIRESWKWANRNKQFSKTINKET